MINDHFWLDEDLYRHSSDGLRIGFDLYINLPEDIMPVSIIDFCARAGFETNALSLDFFEKSTQKFELHFIQSDQTILSKAGNKYTIFYESERELNGFITNLAAVSMTGKVQDPISIRSLDEIWSYSGFGYSHEASPERSLSMNIKIDPLLVDREGLISLSCFAARISLLHTHIQLPLLNAEDERHILFEIKESETNELILQKSNTLLLECNKTNLSAVVRSLTTSKHWSEGGSFAWWSKKMEIDNRLQPIEIDSAPILHEKWTNTGEVNELLTLIDSKKKELSGEVIVFISKDKRVRESLVEKLQTIAPSVEKWTIVNSFKPGYCWIEETVIPELKDKKESITSIKVVAKKEVPTDNLELPIRWLQEMYPIDHLLSSSFNLPLSDIKLDLSEAQDETYSVYIKTSANSEWRETHSFSVLTSTVPYVDHERVATPTTSGIFVRGNTKWSETIQTDRERFYLYYLQHILPKLENLVLPAAMGQGYTSPLFKRIEIDVWMNEEERELGIDQERISSLEALHEDLYFNTLDYFDYLGERTTGKGYNAPGGIVPLMHLSDETTPKAEIKVYGWHQCSTPLPITSSLSFTNEGHLETASMNYENKVIDVPIKPFDSPETSYHPDVDKELTNPNVFIKYADFSFEGHPIPVFEWFQSTGADFVSTHKLSIYRKTIFIEAGHHANEVSSTPAVFELIKKLDDNYGDTWRSHLNIVSIPASNPDGFTLLQRLVNEHPKWKHHAARYNAVGLEFAHIRWQETIFGEANVFPEVMRRWAPDIIIDDHGIPSHEWVQPFAGYNSPPRFPVSYFLPSAKLYGIGRTAECEELAIHKSNLNTLVHAVNDEFDKTKIADMNRYWRNRFELYGNRWLPDVFPLETSENINFYTQMSVTPTYSAVGIFRYPSWVAADIISEAADEVVYDEELRDCIEAHCIFNFAIVKRIIHADIHPIREGNKLFRQRPLKL
ncbi:M14 family metallopeptidase [Chryseomicrobium palamuruense]|uniref:M14 family metallopeptidase n=1 Tax=Chryseomicrobium palamuruense TaxID=682973 RepID=A0ABV8UU66_9BACL